jgi:hypothetical protein
MSETNKIARAVYRNILHKISNGNPSLLLKLLQFFIMFDWQLVIYMKNFVYYLK